MNKNQKMMSDSVSEALILLDDMRKKAQTSSNSYYKIERIEQAMDYLINNPSKQGDPKLLVRDFMGSAGSKIRNRINVIKEASNLAGISSLMTIQQEVNDSINYLTLEIIDEITALSLKEKDKSILIELAQGKDVEDLTEYYKTTVTATRTRISKARASYKNKVGVAI